MAKSFLNIHFYAKNIKKIFKNGVKCKKSGNFGLLNQEFGFSKVYYIYSFYFIKNRSAEKSLLNRESLLYLRLLNQESTVLNLIQEKQVFFCQDYFLWGTFLLSMFYLFSEEDLNDCMFNYNKTKI